MRLLIPSLPKHYKLQRLDCRSLGMDTYLHVFQESQLYSVQLTIQNIILLLRLPRATNEVQQAELLSTLPNVLVDKHTFIIGFNNSTRFYFFVINMPRECCANAILAIFIKPYWQICISASEHLFRWCLTSILCQIISNINRLNKKTYHHIP